MRLDVGNLQLFGIDLRHAWLWWKGGLAEAMPSWLPQIFCKPSPVVRAEWDGAKLRFVQQYSEFSRELACLDQEALAVAADGSLRTVLLDSGQHPDLVQLELHVSNHLLMVRALELPAVDHTRQREALAFQLGRLTPFSADQLYYDAMAVPGELGACRLVAIARSQVDPMIAQIERLSGLRVSRLSALPDSEGLNLFGQKRVPGLWWKRLNLNSILLALLVISMAAAAVLPVLQQRERVIERKAELAELHTRVSHSLEVRNRLEGKLYTLERMLESRPPAPLIEVLSELSGVVPDSVYLSEVRVQGRTVSISGHGTGVVDLIELLNRSRLFEQARLTSSVTRNDRTGLDQFTATLQVRAEVEQ